MKVSFNPNIGMKKKMVAPKEQPISFAKTITKEEEQRDTCLFYVDNMDEEIKVWQQVEQVVLERWQRSGRQ